MANEKRSRFWPMNIGIYRNVGKGDDYHSKQKSIGRDAETNHQLSRTQTLGYWPLHHKTAFPDQEVSTQSLRFAKMENHDPMIKMGNIQLAA